jgi:16S rRNA (cytosine1402-N4)-methyltransferase
VHEPVLVAEVLTALGVRPGGVYVDATLGLGGHTAAILDAGAGMVIGLDRDPQALAHARARLAGRPVDVIHADYRQLTRVLAERRIDAVDGILVDLGVSSMQLDDPERGFSFRHAGPLDMRMDPTSGQPLSERLALVDEATLADVIWTLGEERHSRRIARLIVAARDRGPIATTTELAAIVRRGAGGHGWQRIDPATRTFQALRLWVNGELDGLDAFLAAMPAVLAPGGRLVVIAFHSLEDRIVKHTFRQLAADGVVTLVTRKPVVPSEAEEATNPRSRSARLRAVEKAA